MDTRKVPAVMYKVAWLMTCVMMSLETVRVQRQGKCSDHEKENAVNVIKSCYGNLGFLNTEILKLRAGDSYERPCRYESELQLFIFKAKFALNVI